MNKLDNNNVNTLMEGMIRRTFYNTLGEIVSPTIESVSVESFGKYTVEYTNGQKIEFTAKLIN